MPIKGNAALTVEEETLKNIKKIQQNERENLAFSEKFAKYLSGEMKESEILQLGETPLALQLADARNLPLTMKQSDLRNALNPENVNLHGHTSGHAIDQNIIMNLPNELRNPLFIIQDKNKNLRVIIDKKDKNDDYIMCHIALNKNQGNYEVNKVSSIHGKREFSEYITRELENNNVKAMNEEKAESLLQSIGCQSSKGRTIICFDSSIAYTTANVKYPEETISDSISEEIQENQASDKFWHEMSYSYPFGDSQDDDEELDLTNHSERSR